MCVGLSGLGDRFAAAVNPDRIALIRVDVIYDATERGCSRNARISRSKPIAKHTPFSNFMQLQPLHLKFSQYESLKAAVGISFRRGQSAGANGVRSGDAFSGEGSVT